MDAIRQPLLGLPSPTAYFCAPPRRHSITFLSETRGRLQASLQLCHKGIFVAQCDRGSFFLPFSGIWNVLACPRGDLSSRKQKVHWRINKKQGTPRCEMAAGAKVSQFSNADSSGHTASTSENSLSAQEFFESFLRSRQIKSDFVSKASDVLWKREVFDVDEEKLSQVRTRLAELQKLRAEDDSGGFLKLSQSRQWDLGVEEAPTNAKLGAYDMQTMGYDGRRASFLEYEALKRELSLLTSAVAAFCSIYCGLVFSLEASVSYAIGYLGSLLYLQLLFRHVDQISEENVAAVFMRKRQKKIGIRSSDLQDAIEKAFFGSGFALSSPRLVIPVSLYGLWTLLHRLGDLQLDLQITPLMFGFFAYKGALLVQAVRENKDLAMSFEKENKSGLGS